MGSATSTPMTLSVYAFSTQPQNATITANGSVSLVIAQSTVGNDVVETWRAASLQVWSQNGCLYIEGVASGEMLSVYTAMGVLIYQNIASTNKAEIPVSAKGFYFIRNGNRTAKIVVNG